VINYLKSITYKQARRLQSECSGISELNRYEAEGTRCITLLLSQR
jgi:hypothetical protein